MTQKYKTIYDTFYKMTKDKNIYSIDNLEDLNDYTNMKLKQNKKKLDEDVIIEAFIYSLKTSCNEPFKLDDSIRKKIIKLYKYGIFPIRVGGVDYS